MRRTATAAAVVLCLATLTACNMERMEASTPTSSPDTATSTDAGASPTSADAPADNTAAVEQTQLDVGTVAPRLESFYRGGEYPRTLDEVIASLADAGLSLSEGNSLGAYRYDEQAIEFTLCVEHTSGAWATYDTAPMSLRESGETGGCPPL